MMVRRAWTFLRSLIPGEISAPEAMSSAVGETVERASAALLGVRPPARMTGVSGWFRAKSRARDQSKIFPVPP